MVTVLALKIKTNQLKFVQWQHCGVLIDHEFSCGFSINQWFWQSIPTLIQIQERVGNVVQPSKLFPQCDPSPSPITLSQFLTTADPGLWNVVQSQSVVGGMVMVRLDSLIIVLGRVAWLSPTHRASGHCKCLPGNRRGEIITNYK